MTARRLNFTLTFTLILLLTYSQLYASPWDSANSPADMNLPASAPPGDTVMAHGEVVNLSYVSVIDGFTLSECSISLADLAGVDQTARSVVKDSRFSGWLLRASDTKNAVDHATLNYYELPDIRRKILTYQIICAKNSGPVKTYAPRHNF